MPTAQRFPSTPRPQRAACLRDFVVNRTQPNSSAQQRRTSGLLRATSAAVPSPLPRALLLDAT